MYTFNTKDEKMNTLIRGCIAMCKAAGIPISTDITFELSNQERGHGVCYHSRKTGHNRIRISRYLVTEEDRQNTILHELLHTCPRCQNHGYTWQSHADTIYNKYKVTITRCSDKLHSQVDVKRSRRQYFTREEYEQDGGKYLVAIGRVDQNTPIWYVKKTSQFARHLSDYTCHGVELKFM